MIILKANYWEHYISTVASAGEMRMSYNARMSCVNRGIYILNSNKSLRVFWCVVFFFLAESPLIPLLSQRRRKRMFLSHMFHY